MAKRNTIPNRRSNKSLDRRVENILHDKLAHFLDDISFRIGQQYELAARTNGTARGTVYAEDLHVKDRAFLTGYTLTNNSPSAGSIAWTDLHVVVDGVDYLITNGSTALKFVAFKKPATPPVGGASTALVSYAFDAKPVLAEGDVLLFVNESGVARNMLSDTNATLPRVVATNSIDTDAIAANAVTSTEIGANAVTAGKINAGAINASNLFTGAIIPGANLVADSVTSTQLGNNAVTGNELASGAINNSNKFAANVVDSTAIKDSAVTALQLGTGAVSATKLSIMRHVMY